jgi:hypothetical protein
VRNTRTGQTGRTASLGTGIARGRLDRPVTVEPGDTYEISNTGAVLKAQGDLFLQSMGLVGPGATPYETVGYEYDRAELFAGPYPFYEQDGAAPRPSGSPPAAAAPAAAPPTWSAGVAGSAVAASASPTGTPSSAKAASRAALRRACAKPKRKRLSRKPAKRKRQLAKARKRCKSAKRAYKKRWSSSRAGSA